MSIANADLALYDDHSNGTVLEHLGADDRELERWMAKALERQKGALARPGTTAP